MSGHSKWNNIKRKKEKADGAKAKIFTKIGRELAVAVKEGGSADPAANSRLRDAIAKAKAANVPNDNIDRIIKKAAGDGNSDNYENITYEGYGPSGVAVIVETLTDNRNRTAADVRHAFDKFGGNLGTTGCVSFMFNKKGVIVIEKEGLDEDTVMTDALEAGAADFAADEDVFEITTEPDDFSGVREDLEKKGYEFVSADVEMVPDTYTTITDEDTIVKMQKMLDLLEDNDDVQNVWHNWDAPEEEEEEYMSVRLLPKKQQSLLLSPPCEISAGGYNREKSERKGECYATPHRPAGFHPAGDRPAALLGGGDHCPPGRLRPPVRWKNFSHLVLRAQHPHPFELRVRHDAPGGQGAGVLLGGQQLRRQGGERCRHHPHDFRLRRHRRHAPL